MHNDVQEMTPAGPTPPTMASARTRTHPFVRDRTSALSYGAVGVFAFDLYAFGPALALLRPELHLSYGMIGIHSTVFAGGSIFASLAFRPAVRALGRRRVFWAAAVGMAMGSVIFALAYAVIFSLAGALVMGASGTFLLTATFAMLSDRYGDRREQALVEANIGAGVCGVAAPLILAGLAQTAATWRVAMILPVVAVAGLWLCFRRLDLPKPSAQPTPLSDGAEAGGSTPLPRAFWMLAILVALGGAAEFCVVYFGAELLSRTVHLSSAAAGAALSLFYGGLLVGRVIGSHLTRHPGRGPRTVVMSLVLMMAGFVAFWLTGDLAVALAGLFVTGLGVANLYPLSLSLALAAAPGHTDVANAQGQLVGGVVSLVAPLALGALADAVGLGTAFVIVPVLVVACALMLRAGLAREPGRRGSVARCPGSVTSPAATPSSPAGPAGSGWR
jgi:MFS family permease